MQTHKGRSPHVLMKLKSYAITSSKTLKGRVYVDYEIEALIELFIGCFFNNVNIYKDNTSMHIMSPDNVMLRLFSYNDKIKPRCILV